MHRHWEWFNPSLPSSLILLTCNVIPIDRASDRDHADLRSCSSESDSFVADRIYTCFGLLHDLTRTSPTGMLSCYRGIIVISWNYCDIVELSCYRFFIVMRIFIFEGKNQAEFPHEWRSLDLGDEEEVLRDIAPLTT